MMLSALVPMKRHSERVPAKNLRPFAGPEPLLAMVLRTLEASGVVGEILVDTDCELIAAAARQVSPLVRTIDRPAPLCGDHVSMNRIIAHDLTHCRHEHVLQTHVTNPLLTADTVRAAVERYRQSLADADSLFTVTRWQTRFFWGDGRAVNHDPDQLLRTQDLPPIYEENSCLYLFSKAGFAAAGARRIGRRPVLFEIPRLEAIDIDEEADFQMAQALAQSRCPSRVEVS